jgi:hypothetical protein
MQKPKRYTGGCIQIGILALLLCLAFPVAAGPAGDLVASGSVRLERVDSSRIRIGRVTVQRENRRLIVNGLLRRHLLYRNSLLEHLHISAYDEQGRLLVEKIDHYRGTSNKSRLVSFTDILPVRADEVAKISIRHHNG